MSRKSNFLGINGCKIKQDEIAIARAIAVGIAADRLNAFKRQYPGLDWYNGLQILRDDDAEVARFKDARRNYQKIRKSPSRAHDIATLSILHTAGIHMGMQQLNEDDIRVIQQSLDGRHRIHVFEYDGLPNTGRHIWSGPTPCPSNIFLLRKRTDDGVIWGLIESPYSVIPKWYCPFCTESDARQAEHRCSTRCSRCGILSEFCNEGETIVCEGCCFTFASKSCFERHKRSVNNKGSRCNVLKMCLDCNKMYSVRNTRGQHECGKDTWCPRCVKHVEAGHLCFWKKVEDKDKEKWVERQNNYRFGVYDCETVQSTESEDGEIVYLEEHTPNLIIMRNVCYSYGNDPDRSATCVNCPIREKIFKYQCPEEDPKKVIRDFVDFLLTEPSIDGRAIFAHNGGRFDHFFVQAELLRRKIYPDPITNGNQIIVSTIKKSNGKNGFILKDSYRLIPLPLSQFSSAFAIATGKGHFPYLANEPAKYKNVQYGLPAKKYYGRDNMSRKDAKAFDTWYDDEVKKREHRLFVQEEELISYCRQDVLVLLEGLLKYRATMIEATKWDPLCQSTTIAAFTQFLLRAEFVPEKTMPYLPENGFGAVNQSVACLKWLAWEEKQCGTSILRKNNGGEKKLLLSGGQRCSLDGYCPATKTAFEYHGCYWHGCPRCCPGKVMNEQRGDHSQRILMETRQRERLIRAHPDVDRLHVVWECELEARLKTDKDLYDFFKKEEVIGRLRPRDSLQGGRTEAFATIVVPEEDEEICYYDVVSMYPWVMATTPMPVGYPEVLCGDFPNVDGTDFPYRGIAKLKILPPRNIKKPVLGVKSNNALVFGTCRKCIDARSAVCTHEDPEDRALIGDWTDLELNLALRHGYKILKIFEVWKWERWTTSLYKKYVSQFLKTKVAASGWPREGMNEQEKIDYLRQFENDGVYLTPEQVSDNPSQRLVAKLLLNSSWGKLAENPIKAKLDYVKVEQLVKIQWDPTRRMVSSTPLGDDMFAVRHSPLVNTIHSARFSNLAHATFITSSARVRLYSLIDAVGDNACYVDTDSIMFKCKKGSDPLRAELNGALGGLTNEIAEGKSVTKLVIAAPKNYVYSLSDGSVVLKCKGITQDCAAAGVLTMEAMENMVRQRIENQEQVVISTSRPMIKRYSDFSISTIVQKKRIRMTNNKSSLIDFDRVPFGLYTPV